MRICLMLIIMFIAVAGAPFSNVLAEEFSFDMKMNIAFPLAEMVPAVPTFYFIETFRILNEHMLKEILIKNLYELPRPKCSNIFETIDEISRSITKTSACL